MSGARTGHAAAPDVYPSQDPGPASDSPLRVAGVDPELGFAGGESQVLGLTLELRRQGHRAELLCDPRGALWRRAADSGVACHPLAIRNAVDVGAGLRLRALLRRHRYDVVHFHTSRAHSLAPYARGLAGASIVTRRMDYRPNRLFAPYLYNHAVDAVAAISSGVADSLVATGVRRERIAVIPSGVDCERFRPPSPSERAAARSALALGENEVAIGTVGALEVRKGHRCLIEAIASPVLRASFDAQGKSSIAIRCFIAGEGSQRATLSTDIDRRGLAASVRLIGAIDDPRKLLWALDIFAFPSLHEGLGVALIEAMACGLPAVASATGGIGDLIESGRTGILVAPDDPAQLAQALVRLAAQPGTRETLGVAARARVLEKFSIAAMARGTLELYRLCLARGAKIQGEAAQRCGA